MSDLDTANRSVAAPGEADFAHLQRLNDGGRLNKIKLFDGISDDDLRNIEADCIWLSAKEGDEILTRTSKSKHVFFIVEGSVEIVNFSLSGREVMYAKKPAGDHFGEMAAIDQGDRSASVVALEPCKLAALTPEPFAELLLKHPQCTLKLLRNMVAIIRISDERIMDLATLSAYQRVYSEILKIVRPDPVRPGSWLVYPLPTQAQIATQASTTRETVARVLSQLQQAGITERKTKTLYIRDLDRLQTLADRVAIDRVMIENPEPVPDEAE
jgi:CRP-like cAMP-binding protein